MGIFLYTQIKDNVYSIYVDLPDNPLKNINAYLIAGKDRNLLIDTGFKLEACRRTLLLGLSELGVSMEDTDIFLTHLHSDHTGLASEIVGKDSKIFMSRDDYAWKADSEMPGADERRLEEQRSYGFSEENINEFLRGRSRYQTGDLSSRVTCIDDGAVLSYGGRDLQAILTPGHTPGHMCLYDPTDKIMFLGDHVLFDITPNIIAWRGFKDPLGAYVNSLLDISGYEVELPLPGHRGVTGSMSDRIGAIIEHHGRRLRELADVLDDHSGETAYQLAGHLGWNIRFNGDWECFPTEQKYFAVGETKAHLDYLVTRGRARRERQGEVDYYSSVNKKSALS